MTGKAGKTLRRCVGLLLLFVSIQSSVLLVLAGDYGFCSDTNCGGAGKICCEGSTALQNKSSCIGSSACDSCCGWVSSDIPEKAQDWIKELNLKKQAYGNFMSLTYTSNLMVEDLPARFSGSTRSLSGDIYNLFTVNRSDSTNSQKGFPLHMLEGDEIYHYYAGDGPLILYEFDISKRRLRNISIGSDDPRRDSPQHTIIGGTWTGALLAEGTTWCLTGASTIPGFDPRDSHMAAENATLMKQLRSIFSHQVDLIDRLTSF